MQTKSIIMTVTPLLSTAVSAAALSSGFPTLSGSNWYDWSSSTAAVAAISTSTVNDWDTWTAWSAASVATPAAASTSSASSSSAASVWSWSAVSVPTTTAAAAIVTSSVPYTNPFTIYTTMTNEWGVITGMPAVVTSQPTQPIPAGWSTITTSSSSVKVVAANSTIATATLKPSSSVTGFQQSSSASIAVHTGAASAKQVGDAGLAMIILGFGFSLL